MNRFSMWLDKNRVLAGLIGTLLVAIIASITAIGLKVAPWAWDKFAHEDLTASIVVKDVATGAVSVDFDNSGNRDETITEIVLAILTREGRTRAVTNSDIVALAQRTPGFSLWLPENVGLIVNTNSIRFFVELMREGEFVVPAGRSVVTNLAPVAGNLRRAVEILEDDTPLELEMIVNVQNSNRTVYSVTHRFGTYTLAGQRARLDRSADRLSSFRLLPSPRDRYINMYQDSIPCCSTNSVLIVSGILPNEIMILRANHPAMLLSKESRPPSVIIDPSMFVRGRL